MAASPADMSRRRREKRRQLDARRSKCRIRLGSHMEQWCLLKEQLGFSLHSQLAKFLLDRYTSSGCVLCAGPKPLPLKGLQYLVLLSHTHSQECSLVPGLRGPGGRDGGLVWECSAGHTFSWSPSSGPTPPAASKPALLPSTSQKSWCPEARGGQEPTGRPGKEELWRIGWEKGFHLWSSEPYSPKMILSQWKNYSVKEIYPQIYF
uniref:Zinc finger protein 692 n=1 Tax=Molossus molossus TaxID=27622 RepID=A0A7J8IDM5_MOLMO|nr:zinc finger protein 692 [Molossus molossus]